MVLPVAEAAGAVETAGRRGSSVLLIRGIVDTVEDILLLLLLIGPTNDGK